MNDTPPSFGETSAASALAVTAAVSRDSSTVVSTGRSALPVSCCQIRTGSSVNPETRSNVPGMSRESPASAGSTAKVRPVLPSVTMIGAVDLPPSCCSSRVTASSRDSPPTSTPSTDAAVGTCRPTTTAISR